MFARPSVPTNNPESDARYGSFDFRAAHAAAPADLQELLDQHESLPFRRRGYERDGMLKTVVEHAGERAQADAHVCDALHRHSHIPRPFAGFKELLRASQSAASSKAEVLAAVPAEMNRFVLDALFERPVQATLVELLLLQQGDRNFTSCVLVHGMGGTGKVRARDTLVCPD